MARCASAGGGHPWPAWFQDTVQHAQLLTNRTLRTYLLAHGADCWPEVAKATLLYGVLCLRRDFPGQPVLPLEQLHEAARALHAEATMREALPRIRSQFEELEADVGGFLAELDQNGGPTASRGGGTGGPQMQEPSKMQQPAVRHGARSSARSAASAASSTLNSAAPAPAASRPPKPRQPAIYPDWWPKDAAGPTAAARRASTSGAARQRPQPRLAYSRPPSAPVSVTRDDLPTAAFLLVPPRVSSSRGSPPGKGGAPAGGPSGGPQQAKPRVALQHAQQLALQREQRRWQQQQPQDWGQEQEEVQAGARLGDGSGGGYGAGRAQSRLVPAAAPGHEGPSCPLPGHDAEAAAKWMRHFGIQAQRTVAAASSQ